MIGLRQYAIVTAAYWAFTLTDGALRMLVLLRFHELGYGAVELAFLFVFFVVPLITLFKISLSNKPDRLRPEYDFSNLGPAVRGKYYERVVGRPIVVELRPDSEKAKPTRRKRSARRKSRAK